MMGDAALDADFTRTAPQVELIHAIERQVWGQRVFRIYDPDGHAMEVGAPLPTWTSICAASPIPACR